MCFDSEQGFLKIQSKTNNYSYYQRGNKRLTFPQMSNHPHREQFRFWTSMFINEIKESPRWTLIRYFHPETNTVNMNIMGFFSFFLLMGLFFFNSILSVITQLSETTALTCASLKNPIKNNSVCVYCSGVLHFPVYEAFF